MFKSLKNRVSNLVSHKTAQKAIYNTIITTRKATKNTKHHTIKLANDTKQTWKDAMSADIS